jgi:hypothetical protein
LLYIFFILHNGTILYLGHNCNSCYCVRCVNDNLSNGTATASVWLCVQACGLKYPREWINDRKEEEDASKSDHKRAYWQRTNHDSEPFMSRKWVRKEDINNFLCSHFDHKKWQFDFSLPLLLLMSLLHVLNTFIIYFFSPQNHL